MLIITINSEQLNDILKLDINLFVITKSNHSLVIYNLLIKIRSVEKRVKNARRNLLKHTNLHWFKLAHQV